MASLGAGFLRAHISSILANQLQDDGNCFDPETKCAVGTCRFIINYALGSRCFPEHRLRYRGICAHGVTFLLSQQTGDIHGGLWWKVRRGEVADDTKHLNALAFSLLALVNARLAGVPGLDAHIDATLALAESKYFETEHGLYIDSYDRAHTKASEYRGQKSNMHFTEALIALFEARREVRHLRRAAAIARRLTIELAGGTARVTEHCDSKGVADPVKDEGANPHSEEYRFRPPGFQPGHSMEWAKILILLERHCRAVLTSVHRESADLDTTWMLPRAIQIFDTAIALGWNSAHGGWFMNLEDNESQVRDGEKYHWGMAGAIAASGLLMERCGEASVEQAAKYRIWYERAWAFALRHFVDHKRGGWLPLLGASNSRDIAQHGDSGRGEPPLKCYSSETDYRPLVACFEVLRAVGSACCCDDEAGGVLPRALPKITFADMPRAVLGCIQIATDVVLDSEGPLMIQHLHGVEMRLQKIALDSEILTADMYRRNAPSVTAAASALLPSSYCSVLGLSCTSMSFSLGAERVDALLQSACPGARTTDMARAQAEALGALGVEHVALLTPYASELSKLNVIMLEDLTAINIRIRPGGTRTGGVKVVKRVTMCLERDELTSLVTEGSIAEWAMLADCPEAEAVVVGCSALRACGPGFIDRLEVYLGKPVVTSTQAFMWKMLRLAGVDDRMDGYGTLLREH